MLENKDYCDYETCVALKELGYVGICDAYYELTGSKDYNRDSFKLLYTRDFIHPDDIDRVAAPLLYQAQKWLREEKKIYVEPYFAQIINHMPRFRWMVTNGNSSRFLVDTLDSREHYRSFEEALSEGIKKAVKILKEK